MDIIELILVTLTISTALIEAYVDAKKTKPIEHKLSALTRVCIIYALCLMFIGYNAILAGAILLVLYWLIFDPAYNLFRWGYNEMFYIGTTSFLDKYANKIFERDGSNYMASKALLLFVLIAIYKWEGGYVY